MRYELTCIVVVTICIAAGPITAADKVLELIPADANQVVLIRSFPDLQRKVEKVLPLKELFGGRNRDELDEKQIWAQLLPAPQLDVLQMANSVCVVIHPTPGAAGGPVVHHRALLCVTKEDARLEKLLRATVGVGMHGLTCFRHGDFFIACEGAQSKLAIQRVIQDPRQSLSSALTPEDRELFARGDVSGYLNSGSMWTKELREKQTQELKQLSEAWKKFPGEYSSAGEIASLVMMYFAHENLVSEVHQQAVLDSDKCIGVMQLDESGVHFEGVTRFAADSASARWVKEHPSGSMASIRQFPFGHQILLAAHFDERLLLQKILQQTQKEHSKSGPLLQRWRAALEELAAIRFGTIGVSFGFVPAETGVVELRGSMIVDNVSRLATAWRSLCASARDVPFAAPGIAVKFGIVPEPERFGKRDIDVAALQIVRAKPVKPLEKPDIAADAELEQNIKDGNKYCTMFGGPEGVRIRTTGLADRGLLSLGGGKLAIADAIRRAEKHEPLPNAANQPIEKSLARLWPEANLTVLVDWRTLSRHYESLIERFEAGANAAPFRQPETMAHQAATSYIGVALRNEPQAMRARVVIPVDQLREFQDYILVQWQLAQRGKQPAGAGQGVEISLPVREKE